MDAEIYQHCDPLMLLETVCFDKEIFVEWVSLFLSESLSQYEAMKLTAESGAQQQLEFEAHALKGTVGQTGAEKLVELLLDLETQAKAGTCYAPQNLLEEILQELMATREEMQHYMDFGDFPEE